ncbi:tensin-3 isoform X1 [Anguilla anguilla]|uniref:tensin-3 isoform X1 n=1 Tax=Anguilla anguilla TaxID=7936 RepID=UPI0015AAE998|nr:tensin-3 isoform X1 [Anguilla anguilla]
MEEGYELDLIYVTERIIAVSFPRGCSEETYLRNLQDVTRMLKSKHANNYLVINLSEKRHDLTKMNPKTMDMGWPDLHAPPLDKICSICKAMENWLNADLQHVVVVHCRGGKGRIGVIISSFVNFTNISASAGQALDRFAMRKFYDDKVSALMTPSQKRYVWILNSLLTGSVKMNSSPLFLHCVILHGIPNFDTEGVCRPYLKVYQAMQVVYTSGIYNIGPGHRNRIYIALEPAQILKGDIMVKCYHKSLPRGEKELVFRLQFHTGTVQGYNLIFEKEDLEGANRNPRFPDYGKIELVLSESPERITGSDRWQNGPDVAVDCSLVEALTRWDSYKNLSCDGEVLHAQESRSCSSRPKARQKSSEQSPPGVACRTDHSDHTLSASSDSGLSSTSVLTGRAQGPQRGPSQQEATELKRLLCGFGVEGSERSGAEMPGERSVSAGPARGVASARGARVNGEARRLRDRETDILDDDEDGLHSVDSIGTMSSSEGRHKGSHNSLLSDDFGSHGGDEHHASVSVSVSTAMDTNGGRDDYGRDKRDFLSRGAAIPVIRVTQPPAFGQEGYSTQTWVRQQQMVAAQQYPYMATEGDLQTCRSPTVPEVTIRGKSDNKVDEFAALTVDIDQSIDQLNQLIMDLDPTFMPVAARSNSVKKTEGSHTTRSTEHQVNGLNCRRVDSNGTGPQNSYQSAVPPNDVRADRPQGLNHQGNDVTGCPGFRPPGWGLAEDFLKSPVYTPDLQPCQQGILYRTNSVGYRRQGEELDCRVAGGIDIMVPPTPSFPVSPGTPYVKEMSEFPHASVQGGFYRTEQESRSCVESNNHFALTSGPSVNVSPAPCQRPAGMTCAVSTSGPLPRTESVSSGHSWPEGGRRAPQGCQSPQDPRLSPPQSHPVSLGNSPPGGAQRGGWCRFEDRDGPGLSPVPGQGLLGLGPPLPEKRRISEGERSLRSPSPCLSGFSSPLSGSTSSLPFPNVLSEPHSSRALDTPSPVLDLLDGKHVTVKFVQDTTKFWYKPDISRDQAIAVLKDREPGAFIVRDSHSFRGAYGLAMKVATPPPSVLQQGKKGGDLSIELVRHFLIECTPKGVRLKGCPNEPYFGSLTALVCQHSITPLALPCKLIIPNTDPLEELQETPPPTISNSAAELLKQGAACNVWFLGSLEMESLTGHQAIQKATAMTLNMDPPPISTVVHFKVSAQGITLTDNQRKLFFRRHYAASTVIFCALDPQNRKWMRNSISSAKIFGFVARKSGSAMENMCHLFAEHDPEQPASAIVNFVSKVMIGSHKLK